MTSLFCTSALAEAYTQMEEVSAVASVLEDSSVELTETGDTEQMEENSAEEEPAEEPAAPEEEPAETEVETEAPEADIPEEIVEPGETLTEEVESELLEAPEAVENPYHFCGSTKVVGHRGLRFSYPENTLQSYQGTFDAGMDGIDVDVFEVNNGDLMIAHSDTTGKYCDVNVSILNVNTTNRKQYPITKGSGIEKYKKGKVLFPTFEEALELAKRNDGYMFAELKNDLSEAGARKLAKAVYDAGMEDRVFIIASGSVERSRRVLSVLAGKGIHRGRLVHEPITVETLEEERRSGMDGLIPWTFDLEKLRPEVVEYCHKNNMWLCGSVCNFRSDYDKLVEGGVDFICSDFTPEYNKPANVLKLQNIALTYSPKAQKTKVVSTVAAATELTYVSNRKEVAVDSTGAVTVQAGFVGVAKITVTALEAALRGEVSATMTVTVQKAPNNIKTAASVVQNVSSKKRTLALKVSTTESTTLTYQSNNKSVVVNSRGGVAIAKNFVGQAVITIKSKATGHYLADTKKVVLTVRPVGTSITKVSYDKKKKLVGVSWKKKSGITGYQVRIAKDKTMKTGVVYYPIKSASATYKSIKSKYSHTYVQVRTYKTVSGKKIYSAWSSVKKVY